MSFYTAASGAGQQQARMNVQANNIANIGTYGFKAERPSFAALMYGVIQGAEGAQLPRGSGGRMAMAGTDFGQGAVADTGRSQDYAILGDGFFALYDPGADEISYTRSGAFSPASFRQPGQDGVLETVYMLSDGNGRFVLDRQGGLIQVTDADAEQPVGVFDFMSVDGMRHLGENRFAPVEKNGPVRLGSGSVRRGMLEMSNTDLAAELGKVIEAQRSYSYALKMVQATDEVETTINGLRT